MVVPNSLDEADRSRAKALGVDALGLTVLTDYNPNCQNKKVDSLNSEAEKQSKSSFKFFFRR